MTMVVLADVGDIDKLVATLTRDAATITPRVAAAVQTQGAIMHAAARANAERIRDTGELAESLVRHSFDEGLTSTTFSGARQGFFQEYGSPNTGPPNPWASGPAELAQAALLTSFRKVVGPW